MPPQGVGEQQLCLPSDTSFCRHSMTFELIVRAFVVCFPLHMICAPGEAPLLPSCVLQVLYLVFCHTVQTEIAITMGSCCGLNMRL